MGEIETEGDSVIMVGKSLLGSVTTAALLLAGLTVACAGGVDGPGDMARVDFSAEEVYARAAEAMTRPGHVYHAVVELDITIGESSGLIENRYWLDAERDLARFDWDVRPTSEGGGFSQAVLVRGESAFRIDAGGVFREAPAECPSIAAAISLLLFCGDEIGEVRAELNEFEGTEAIVLIGNKEIEGSDETIKFTQRMYVDANTFLLLAVTVQGTFDDGDLLPFRRLARFVQDGFLPRNSVPADLFEAQPPEGGEVPTPTVPFGLPTPPAGTPPAAPQSP